MIKQDKFSSSDISIYLIQIVAIHDYKHAFFVDTNMEGFRDLRDKSEINISSINNFVILSRKRIVEEFQFQFL